MIKGHGAVTALAKRGQEQQVKTCEQEVRVHCLVLDVVYYHQISEMDVKMLILPTMHALTGINNLHCSLLNVQMKIPNRQGFIYERCSRAT